MTSRVRSRNFQLLSSSSYQSRTNGGAYVPYGPYSSNSSLKTATMTDEVSVGYFAKKRSGVHLPMNPMSKTSYKVINSDGGTSEWRQWLDPAIYPSYPNPYNSCTRTGSVGYDAWLQASGMGSEIFPNFQSTVVAWPNSNTLLIKALANANAHGWDAGTFMAELGKTIDMIRSFRDNTFRRAHRITATFEKKKRFSTTQAALAAFSQTWLEGRYGWRTLAYDLEDINVALIKLKALQHDFIRATESETAKKDFLWRSPTAYAFTASLAGTQTGWISRATIGISQTLERRTRAGVMLQGIADGLAFVDPLVTGWEVVPFSFVVDWFTNIGDNVAAFSPFATGSLTHGFITTEEVVRSDLTCTPIPPNVAGIYKVSVTGPTAYKFVTERSTYTRVAASPSFSLSFQININPEKIVDLASIFFLRYNGLLKGLQKLVRV